MTYEKRTIKSASADIALAKLLASNPELSVKPEPSARPMPDAARQALARLQLVAVSLLLPYPPSANRYWRYVHGHPVVSAEAKAYRDAAGMVARHQGIAPFTGPVAVTIHLYRPQKSGDLDNRVKILLDAMKGVAFNDDDQVTELHAWLHDDKANPRAEVEIRQVTP
jgi:crossover junction endodeoxyribonuclease RusA